MIRTYDRLGRLVFALQVEIEAQRNVNPRLALQRLDVVAAELGRELRRRVDLLAVHR